LEISKLRHRSHHHARRPQHTTSFLISDRMSHESPVKTAGKLSVQVGDKVNSQLRIMSPVSKPSTSPSVFEVPNAFETDPASSCKPFSLAVALASSSFKLSPPAALSNSAVLEEPSRASDSSEQKEDAPFDGSIFKHVKNSPPLQITPNFFSFNLHYLPGLDAETMFNRGQGFTYDDIIMLPGHIDFGTADVVLETHVTRNLKIKTPFLSSPMDTVTEADMAIALALQVSIFT
jgi:hypothetical protein